MLAEGKGYIERRGLISVLDTGPSAGFGLRARRASRSAQTQRRKEINPIQRHLDFRGERRFP